MLAWLTTLSLLLTLGAQDVWVVDAAGGGDFTSLSVAVDSVPAGDVLVVKGGLYGPFQLSVFLTLVGDPADRPEVYGRCRVDSVQGATLAGLTIRELDVTGVRETLLLDDLVLGVASGPGSWPTFQIVGSSPVLLQRCDVQGKDGSFLFESPGAIVTDSDVTFSDCTVAGGDGFGDTFEGYDGQPGVRLEGASHVLLAGSSVTGGDGGTPQVIISGSGGDGSAAVRVGPGSTCVIRGNAGHLLRGGLGGGGAFPGADAFWAVSGSGALVLSGVATDPAALSPGLTTTLPDPAQPFHVLQGPDLPGADKRLAIHGPAGKLQWVLASLASAHLTLPGSVDGSLHLDPAAAFVFFPLTTVGQETGVVLPFQLPSAPGLEGALVVVQGFAQGMGAAGNWLATNPTQVVLR